MPERLTVIVGAGPAGLTAAYLLSRQGDRVVVLEADEERVGGISKTVEHEGFLFDVGGHRFFSKSKEIEDLWREMLPEENWLTCRRKSRIFYRGRFFSYPLRAGEAFRNLGIAESVRCLFSYLKARLFPVREPRTFEDWVSNQFGKRLFTVFFKTYTEKVWGIPCHEISADWAAQRIKGLNLSSAIRSALGAGRESASGGEMAKTLISSFRYPLRGPGMLWEHCARKVKESGGEIRLGQRVTACAWDAEKERWLVKTMDGEGRESAQTATHLISSAPLRSMAGMLEPAISAEAARAAEALRYRDFLVVAVILKDRGVLDDHWIYIHDPSVQVGRIQNFKAWSPGMTPDDSLACFGMEYFCFAEGDGLWQMTDENLGKLAARELEALGLAEASDIVDTRVVRQKKAYPVYDESYAANVAVTRSELESKFPTLYLAGRNGMHKYNNQDHSMMTGILCARNILAGERRYDPWLVNEDAGYHEAGDSVSGLRQAPGKLSA